MLNYCTKIQIVMEVMISSKMVRAITKYTLHALGIYSLFTRHGNNNYNPDSRSGSKTIS